MHQDNDHPERKLNVWLPLLFSLVLIGGIWIGRQLQDTPSTVVVEAQEDYAGVSGQGKLEELVRYIEAKYVDEIDRDALVDEAIENILAQLDPHSGYIPADRLKEINEQLEGNFEGIGVEFMILDDTIVVVSVLPGGPSDISGLLAGDKIVEVVDSVIAGVGIASRDVMNLLRGEKGSEVEVGIRRGKETKLRRFRIRRDKIPMNSLDIAYMLDDKIGYIKINRFSATTYDEFMKVLEQMVEEEGMKDLVLDLRHNPGGYLQQATSILSQLFKEKDELLVYTEGRNVHRSNYETTGRALYDIDDIVVLIDEGSASASEILAGAVQDHDRGYIVGRRSFGKGLVQEQYRLRDGSALRLTVARYFTPSGRSIQKAYEDPEEYENDFMERMRSGELTSENKVAIADTTQYFTSKGRVVFGGGGIMPDVFVPMDTFLMNEDFLSLRQQVPFFVFRYLEENRERLDHFTLEEYSRRFSVSESVYREFLHFAEMEGVSPDLPLSHSARKEIKLFIKARIAKHLFDDLGFYMVWNREDPFIHEAVEVLSISRPITSK